MRSDIEDWVDAIIEGDIVSGRWVRLACERYRRDCDTHLFDEIKATKALEFGPRYLKHTKGEFSGRPFVPSMSQKFVMWNVFGFQTDQGYRRFRRMYITTARKWGKSTFGAVLALTLLYADRPIEPDAEGYCVATKEEQASIVHSQACKMAINSPELSRVSEAYRYTHRYRSLVLKGEPYNGSVFRALGADSKTQSGFNPHFVILDELHEWQPFHQELLEKLRTGGGSRRQPLEIMLTTAGNDQSTIWMEEDNYAQQILLGNVTADSTFAFIARLDEARPCTCDGGCDVCGHTGEIAADDPFDEANWIKSNPDIGVTPSWEYLRVQADHAKNQPGEMRSWMRYHCNVHVRSEEKIINPEVWAACPASSRDWRKASAACGAFDLGLRNDLCAVVIIARWDEGANSYYELKHVSFVAADAERDLSGEPWYTWHREGWLIDTPGREVDIGAVREQVNRWATEYGVRRWKFDPWNASQLGQELETQFGFESIKFPQSYGNYNEPIREFLRVLKLQCVSHGGDRMLGWQASNLVVKEGARGDWMPDRKNSSEKIDAMCAAFMAFSGVMVRGSTETGKYYETHELEVG